VAWLSDGIVVAYTWPSIMEIIHAHRQSRQKPQPPRLSATSVSRPAQSVQAQFPDSTRLMACTRSNIGSMIAAPGPVGILDLGAHLRATAATSVSPRELRARMVDATFQAQHG
jgi:hypothetical protein